MDKNSTIVYVFDNTKPENWELIDYKSLNLYQEFNDFFQSLEILNLEPSEHIISELINYAKK